MALIRSHILSDAFERRILAKLRSLKISRPLVIAETLTSELMAEVPIEAFEPRDPSELGMVFFHGSVEEEAIVKCQEAIHETHINIPKKTPITLYLSTFGGSVFAGLALVSTIQEIRRDGRTVNVHIQGAAMSMGSLITQACDLRTIEPSAWFMVHELRHWLPDMKTAELKDEAEFADRLELQTFQLYSARTGKPVDYYRRKMHRRDWFMTAQEAEAEGLVDDVKAVPPYPRHRKRREAAQSTSAA